jgi:hypothetical protein
MLIAKIAGNRHLRAERPADPRHPVRAGGRRGMDAREHPAWNTEQIQQLVVPVERPQVHQLCAAGVGRVGDVEAAVRAARQIPDDPRVDGAEDRAAACRGLANALHVVEDPLQLRG